MILYHAPTHKRSLLSSSRMKKDTLNLMACFEQPQYTPLMNDVAYLSANFQMMITYSFAKNYPRTSVQNIPMSYFPLELFSPHDVLKTTIPFRNKTAFGSSNDVNIPIL